MILLMIDKAPFFSIITITRNNKRGLSKTAHSIENQTYQNFEWVIIDGASTDGTQDDFANYSLARIMSEPDNGIYDAMNKGIEVATGGYLIFMNAGDIFASNDVLEKISNVANPQPDFIYGDSREDNHDKRARSHIRINWGMFTHHQSMFYNRKSLSLLRYDLDYKIAADYDLTLRFLRTNKNIIYTPIHICIFEVGGISQTNAKRGRDEQFESRKKNKSCGQLQNHLIRLIQLCRFKLRKYLPSLYWSL
jgi:putative colanic acid biosynthesis glycosyltransferase